MSETEWHSPEPDDADWIAPETGGPNEAASNQENLPPDYSATNNEERETVLRHADNYLYTINRKDPGMYMEGEKARTIFRPTFSERVKTAVARFAGNSAKDMLGPLDYAYAVARDDKQWEALVDKEKAARAALDTIGNQRGLGLDRDINPKRVLELAKLRIQERGREREMARVSLFRTAIEFRKDTLRLLAEQETASSDRQVEIDNLLNEKYASLMAMAHTQSWELVRQYKAKEVTGDPVYADFPRDNYGLRSYRHWTRKKEDPRMWRWRGSRAKWKQDQVSDLDIETRVADDREVRYEQDKSGKHREWLAQTMAAEQDGRLGTGFEQSIKNEGELTTDNVAEARRESAELLERFMFLSKQTEKNPDDLKTNFGIELRTDKGKVKKFTVPGGKGKKTTEIEASPSREITVDLGNGKFVVLALEHGGFIGEKKDSDPGHPAFEDKDGKIIVHVSPSPGRQTELITPRLTSVSFRNNAERTKVTQVLNNPTPEQLANNPEYQRLAQILARAEQDFVFRDADRVVDLGHTTSKSLENDIKRWQLEIAGFDRQIDEYHDSLKQEPRWATMTDLEKTAALQRVPSNIKREIELRNGAIKSTQEKAEKLAKALVKVATTRAQNQTRATRQATEKLEDEIRRIAPQED